MGIDATTKLEIMSSVEATVIIIAACLPTLRPVFLLLTGRQDTRNNGIGRSSKKLSDRSHSYQLQSAGADSSNHSGARNNPSERKGGKGRKPSRDPYSVDLEADSMEDHILSSQKPHHQQPGEGEIVKMVNVDIRHDTEGEARLGEGDQNLGRKEEWESTVRGYGWAASQ